jgi:hypothetical protein
MSLRLDFCSREAATFAVKAWHYSHSMPAGRLVCVGVWEFDLYIGCLVFGRGASSKIASPFGLRQDQICELCRIALSAHHAHVSRILSIAIRLLRKQSPNLRAIISYSDPGHGHDGRGVYAAAGWMFIGSTNAESLIRLKGHLLHPRTVASRYRTRSIEWLREHVATDAAHVRTLPKFRYAMPLDAVMRRQLAPRVQPYPKRPKEQAPAHPAGLAGATPSRPLHVPEVAHVL